MSNVDRYRRDRSVFMALIGMATTEGASLEAILATLVARLAAPPALVRADHLAFESRRARVARKPYSSKIDLLELVWPRRWTSVNPLATKLRDVGNKRNDLAHTYEQIDFMSMVQADLPPAEVDLAQHWTRTSRAGKAKAVDFAEIQDVFDDLREQGRRLTTLFFVDHLRDVPIDVEWVLLNEAGSVTRVDKPETHPDFGGWLRPPS